MFRMSNSRLVKEAVKVQFYARLPGSIIMDAPQDKTFEQLEKMTNNRKSWKNDTPADPKTDSWSVKIVEEIVVLEKQIRLCRAQAGLPKVEAE